MTPRKKRRTKQRFTKKILLLFLVVATLAGIGFGGYWFVNTRQAIVIRPVPEGLSLNLTSKGEDQKIKAINDYFSKEKIELTSIEKASDSALIVKLKDNGEIYLSEENYVAELTSLQVILKRLTMEGKRFRRLDLRYERPVIVL